jgi:hypothetical protein
MKHRPISSVKIRDCPWLLPPKLRGCLQEPGKPGDDNSMPARRPYSPIAKTPKNRAENFSAEKPLARRAKC